MIAKSGPSSGDISRGRRPWLAFILSLFGPGLGHLYAGSLRQAVLAILAWTVLAAVSVWLFIQPLGGPFAIWAAALLLLAALIGVPLHAANVARSGTPLRVSRWLRIGIYMLYAVAFSEAATRAAAWVRSDLAEPFRVPSNAMFPTLHVGDHFFADKRAYVERTPERGDVVVFWIARDGRQVFPADSRLDLPRERFVKRIVGVPGDRIQVVANAVYLNGTPLPASHAASTDETGGQLELFAESLGRRSHTIARDPSVTRSDFPEIVVPSDRYFVMGDNRDYSSDSRHWGTVSRSDIVARVSHIYFSYRPSTGSIGWNRIGMRVVAATLKLSGQGCAPLLCDRRLRGGLGNVLALGASPRPLAQPARCRGVRRRIRGGPGELQLAPGRFGAVAGAAQFLERLEASEWDFAFATGGWGRTARLKLQAAGLPTGRLLASSDDSPDRSAIFRKAQARAVRTWEARCKRTVLVGDGIWDVRVAAHLGWPLVGVGGGEGGKTTARRGRERFVKNRPSRNPRERLLVRLSARRRRASRAARPASLSNVF